MVVHSVSFSIPLRYFSPDTSIVRISFRPQAYRVVNHRWITPERLSRLESALAKEEEGVGGRESPAPVDPGTLLRTESIHDIVTSEEDDDDELEHPDEAGGPSRSHSLPMQHGAKVMYVILYINGS